jgi:hypothetical protein
MEWWQPPSSVSRQAQIVSGRNTTDDITATERNNVASLNAWTESQTLPILIPLASQKVEHDARTELPRVSLRMILLN